MPCHLKSQSLSGKVVRNRLLKLATYTLVSLYLMFGSVRILSCDRSIASSKASFPDINLMLSVSIFSILSFPECHVEVAYAFFLFFLSLPFFRLSFRQ